MISSNPVTGRERRHSDGRAMDALVAFYSAFNARDIEALRVNWSDGVDALLPSMSNPIGGLRRGWSEIGQGYAALFESRARISVEFHDYTHQEVGDVAVFAGRERGACVTSDTRLELAIRTTRIFVQIGGVWRQLHHHGSFENGELLSAYQRAVLSDRPRKLLHA